MPLKMKVTLEPIASSITFPVVLQSRRSGSVVLFTSSKTGVFLHVEKGIQRVVGEMSNEVHDASDHEWWKPCSITLSSIG